MKLRLWLGMLPALCAAADLQGLVDLHVHAAPDVVARSLDGMDAARQAKAAGLRAVVLKNHYEPTASWAHFAARSTPGIEVFGGIALNRAVGGVNPAAVSRMARVIGGRGRIVWMPTFDAEHHVRHSGESRPSVSISRGGRLLPEVLEVLDLIRSHGLVLATGHSSPEEVKLLIQEARKRGIDRIIVTHAMLSPVKMTVEQMKEAADLGAFMEFVYHGLIGTAPESSFKQYADAIRRVGPGRCVLASDLGQAGNPLPVDGLRRFVDGMREHGFTEQEIQQMASATPAKLLGLP